MRSQFRPCIDIHDGKVKQIVGGTLDNSETPRTNFVSEQSSAYFASLYRRDDLRGGHVIMLGRNNESAAKEALAAYPGGLQVGGGIDPSNAAEYLDAGASAVIVTSYVFCNGELNLKHLQEISSLVGRDKLVLDLSCRKKDGKYFIVTDRWQKFTAWEVSSKTLDLLSNYAAEYLVHAVDVEGKCAGIDEVLVAFLAENSPLECVYAGGISSFADIDKIKTTGRGRIHYTIGSALDIFGGKLSYREVVDQNKE